MKKYITPITNPDLEIGTMHTRGSKITQISNEITELKTIEKPSGYILGLISEKETELAKLEKAQAHAIMLIKKRRDSLHDRLTELNEILAQLTDPKSDASLYYKEKGIFETSIPRNTVKKDDIAWRLANYYTYYEALNIDW